jgi:hypothetical protein
MCMIHIAARTTSGGWSVPEARFFYSQQRYYDPTPPPLTLNDLHLATNRTFDVEGNETTLSLNAFGQHVFGGDVTLSPTDR